MRTLTKRDPKRTNPVDRETLAKEMTLFLPQGGFRSMGLLKDRASHEGSEEGSMPMMMSPGLLPKDEEDAASTDDSREPG